MLINVVLTDLEMFIFTQKQNKVTPDHESDIYADQKRTLVVGASLRRERFSNIAVRRLSEYHIPVIAVGLRAGEINVSLFINLFPLLKISIRSHFMWVLKISLFGMILFYMQNHSV